MRRIGSHIKACITAMGSMKPFRFSALSERVGAANCVAAMVKLGTLVSKPISRVLAFIVKAYGVM
jgi:hypothetical protein